MNNSNYFRFSIFLAFNTSYTVPFIDWNSWLSGVDYQ